MIVDWSLLTVQQRAPLDLLEIADGLSIVPACVWLVPHSMFHKHSVGGGFLEVLLCTDEGSQSVIVSVGVKETHSGATLSHATLQSKVMTLNV